MSPAKGHLIYAFDAYCGWCYGFTPWLRSALADRPEVTVEVVSGGLFTGARRVPIRELGHIPTVRHRVTQATDAVFGPAFLRILDQGDFVMDSQDAAVGLAGLRAMAPHKVLDFAGDMSRAFYHDGLSLSDPETYRIIATRHHLDGTAAAAALTDPVHRAQARTEFARARALGVQAYPTLYLDTETGPRALDAMHANPRVLAERIDHALSPAHA